MKTDRRQERDAEAARRAMMAVLAETPADALDACWQDAGIEVSATPVRGPETGLVTVRGRIGGGGAPFNFGEATVTRATVRLATGEIGHSYALGRDRKKARLAATIDAAWQNAALKSAVEEKVVAPLRQQLAVDDRRKREEAAATRVDFFTLVRGED